MDFGLATYANGNVRGQYGTPKYIAPEVIKGFYNEKCDIWSLGVTVFYLLTHECPFNMADKNSLFL